MTDGWWDIDEARSYAGGLPRKALYAMVKQGMRVWRVGSTGRRLLFCKAWIDEFAQAHSMAETKAEELSRHRATGEKTGRSDVVVVPERKATVTSLGS